MRKLKFILSIITVVIIAFTSLSQLNSQNNPNMKKGFYLGPMSHYFLNVLETGSHHQWYQDLSYNMMQSYCAHLDSIDSTYQTNGQKDGGFFEDTINYVQEMRQVIENWHDIANDNSLIFEREKILRPAYGQRFTYQAEDPGTWHSKFPSYGYASTDVIGENIDDTISGVTIRVRYCKAGRDTAGFMVKDLYENCSQTNNTTIVPDGTNSSGHDRLYSDIKQPEYKMRWFIKPRMRIDSSYAKAHPNDTVVVVYVKNFDGDVFDTTIIKCRNFLDLVDPLNPKYNGGYLERYFNFSDSINYLSVRADSLAIGKASVNENPYNSLVDYQVKWLGKVDVWLDYVRVDDSWAHYLFTDTWENEILPGNQNPWKFHLRIKEEVEAFIGTNNGLGYFWVDEVQYPNIECIGEVNKLIKRYSNNQMSLLFITDPKAFIDWTALRNKDIANEKQWDSCMNKAIRDSALIDIMITQWFPFYYFVRYPDVFPNIPLYYYISQYVFPAQNYCTYTSDNDNSVQNTVSWFLRQHKYFYKKAIEKGLIYGVINQINSDENNITGSGLSGDWGIREPTNEEISLLMHTSMSYGAKVMLEFSYTSKLQDTGKHTYNWGLTSPEPFLRKRDTNYYGQNKWDFVADLNNKLKRTGDYMYPMNNPNEHLIHDKTLTVNTVTYPECTECGYANYDYINEIRSLAPLINTQNPCVETGITTEHYDCPNERFWELGFFKHNTSSVNQNDKSKYLYAVNKRTYPRNTSNNLGDVRILKIRFNASNLPSYNNWVIKEAITDSVLAVFDKMNNNFITVASFEPGEGKLLKIAPVMQEGGTFVCNEYVSASAGSFDCKDIVTNNGYELEIEKGVTINFTDTAKIEFSHSRFKSGVSGSGNNVILKGTGSGQWSGINLSECELVDVEYTTFQDIMYSESPNSQNTAINLNNCANCYIANSTFYLTTQSSGIYALYTEISEEESEEICNIIAYNTLKWIANTHPHR